MSHNLIILRKQNADVFFDDSKSGEEKKPPKNQTPTVVTDGPHFGRDVDDDATVLLCLLCRLPTKAAATFLQEGGKVFCHNQRTHCVGGQRGYDALK